MTPPKSSPDSFPLDMLVLAIPSLGFASTHSKTEIPSRLPVPFFRSPTFFVEISVVR